MEFNKDGFLEAGLHKYSLEEFENIFVNSFRISQSRKKIFERFMVWWEKLIQIYHIHEIWIDGSFVTNKINPNDIDVVVFVHVEDFLNLSRQWASIRNDELIDAYLTLAICKESEILVRQDEYYEFINSRNYWRGQFGFDRNDSPKGFVVINGEKPLSKLDERGDFECL